MCTRQHVLSLALAGANKAVFKLLGLSWSAAKLPVAQLHSASLPDFFLALRQQDCLQQNALHINNALQPKGGNLRSLDSTYLQCGLHPLATMHGRGFGRGAWSLDAEQDKSLLQLEEGQTWDAKDFTRSTQMLELLTYMACRQQKATSVQRVQRPSQYLDQSTMFQVVGQVLAEMPAVRFITADNATEHSWVKSFLLGLEPPVPKAVLEATPCFKDMVFKPLPAHN